MGAGVGGASGSARAGPSVAGAACVAVGADDLAKAGDYAAAIRWLEQVRQPGPPAGEQPAVFGPYETESATYAEPMYTAWRDLPLGGIHEFKVNRQRSEDLKLNHLLAACGNAGVHLGKYDQRILRWLAGFETAAVQVVIGLISRAHALDDEDDLRARIAELELQLAQERGEA